jgi:hypothetical protein
VNVFSFMMRESKTAIRGSGQKSRRTIIVNTNRSIAP